MINTLIPAAARTAFTVTLLFAVATPAWPGFVPAIHVFLLRSA
jgi:hypothetical protein